MDLIETSAKRLRLLREKHNLSMGQLAEFLFFDRVGAYGSISAWENQHRLINGNDLRRYCRCFAVSADYILGVHDVMYTEECVCARETELLKNVIIVDGYNISFDFVDWDDYFSKEKSLEVRADVIYLYQVVYRDIVTLIRSKCMADGANEEAVQAKFNRLVAYIREFDNEHNLVKHLNDLEKVVLTNKPMFDMREFEEFEELEEACDVTVEPVEEDAVESNVSNEQ